MKRRLYRYESKDEVKRQRIVNQRDKENQRAETLEEQRKTLLKVAEIVESPIITTTSVAALRSRFTGKKLQK